MKILKSFLLTLVFFFTLTAARAASVYEVDATHSSVVFSVDYLVISKTTGKFANFSGTLTWDDADLSQAKITGVIDAKSIDTDNDKRDAHLRSADFFDVEKFPEIKFVTTKIVKEGTAYKAFGDLTMHGVTKKVELPFKITGKIQDFSGNPRLGLSSTFTINRKDYGMNWNKALDNGGVVVSDAVTLQIDMQAIGKAEGK